MKRFIFLAIAALAVPPSVILIGLTAKAIKDKSYMNAALYGLGAFLWCGLLVIGALRAIKGV